MIDRTPALIAALCLSVYWFWVFVKLIRLGHKLGKDPNAVPRERIGQLMRVVWYPCIFVLLVGLWMAAGREPRGLRMESGIRGITLWIVSPGEGWRVMAVAATLVCVACTAFTFVCWRKMGRSWRIGIDPGEKLAIVSSGPYRYVRHPIYSLRMVINVCAVIMAPTTLVLVAAGIDFVLLQIEARREERYMESKHGLEYTKYKNSVGRFIPRAFVV